jgi:hypothetical protein
LQASAGIFSAVAAPLGNIDKVVVIEQGNGASGDATGGIGRIARTGPALVFGLLQQLQALGLDVPTILSQLGLNGGKSEAPKAPEVITAESRPLDAGATKPAPKVPPT